MDTAKTTTRLLSGGKKYGTSEDKGVRRPISKTRLKQGIEAEGRDRFNVSNTILKQGIAGCLVYCANMPMTIGTIDYKKGGRKGGIAPMCLRPL